MAKNKESWDKENRKENEQKKLKEEADAIYNFYDGIPFIEDIDGHVVVCKDALGCVTKPTKVGEWKTKIILKK